MTPARAGGSRSPRLRIAAVLGLGGVCAMIGGTFLPWVRSGQVDRNIYAVAGAADRLGVTGFPVSGYLALAGPICLVPVLVAALRLRRSAAASGLVIALVYGGATAAILVAAAGRSALDVSLASTGPVTVLVGSALLAVGSAGALRAPSRRRTGATSAAAPAGEFRRNPPPGVPEAPH